MASDGEARQVVVVGVDGSDESVAALSWAGRYAAATGATLRPCTSGTTRPPLGCRPA